MSHSAADGGCNQGRQFLHRVEQTTVAVNVFLKIESDVPEKYLRESKDPYHRDWIDVLSFSTEITIAKEQSNTGNAARARVNIVNLPDRSSGALWEALFRDSKIKR